MKEAVDYKELRPTPLSILLVNMEGEFHLPLHEPIGIECIASRVLIEMPETKLKMYDTQPEIMQTGRIDTTRLAQNIRNYANENDGVFLLGISAPIYSWEYVRSLLIKLEDDYKPKVATTIVLGHAIPTYTDARIIKREFPYTKLVMGEGEEIFAEIAKKISHGEPVEDTLSFKPVDLANYAPPLRELLKPVIGLGGSAKLETSRGCNFGACTFCSRHSRGGKDYRIIPENVVVKEVQKLIEDFNISRFELTDEEAFSDSEAVLRLISAWKSANLPHVHFVASLRVSTLLKLEEEGVLDQLQEIGLTKVFLGAEGGSDSYLKQLAKGQNVSQIAQAIGTAEYHNLELELGFITFSWRMDFEMLRKNVEFLSQGNGHFAKYVPSLFNVLEVRAGTLDEVLLQRYARAGKIQNYDPDEKFNVNFSCYQDVPFLDKHVEEAYRKVTKFVEKDKRVYGALKSLVRAKAISPTLYEQLEEFYLRFKDLYLQLLRHATNIEPNENLDIKRREVLRDLEDLIKEEKNALLEPLRRELKIFFAETDKPEKFESEQIESKLVVLNKAKKILLIRLRGKERWSLPGKSVQEEEDQIGTNQRWMEEQLGIKDGTKAIKPFYILREPHGVIHHYLVSFDNYEEVNIENADYEIVDTLWLSLQDVLSSRVKIEPTVRELVETLLNPEKS